MSPQELIASIERKQQEELAKPNPDHEVVRESAQEIVDALVTQNQKLAKLLLNLSPDVTVKNFPEFPKLDQSELVKAVKGLETSLKPTVSDHSDITNAIKELMSQNVKLEAAISKLEVKPQVKVDAPVLNVPATDFKPVIKAIKDAKPEPTVFDTADLKALLEQNLKATEAVALAVKSQEFRIPNTPTDPLIKYAESDIDDTDAGGALKTVRYFGYTDNSGAWYIKRFDVSGQGTTGKAVRYSFGQSNYTTNWTNRAALTYTMWGS